MAISTTHDIVPDSPTNVFATLNPLYPSSISVSDGNLTTGTFKASDGTITSSMQMLSNAITYFEIYYETSYSKLLNIGLMENYKSSSSWGIRGDGEPWNNAPETAVSLSFDEGDILGVIVDVPNNKWYLAKNGSLQLSANISNGTGYIHNNLSSNLSLRCWNASNSGSQKIRANFGQDPTFGAATGLPTAPSGSPFTDSAGYGSFYYDPTQIASDALALCTANLPDPAIDPAVDDLPEDYFKTVIWTGDGLNPRSINGLEFKPDLIIAKRRNASGSNWWIDSVRGVQRMLASNTTDPDDVNSPNGSIDSFDSNGFTLQGTTTNGNFNNNNTTHVAWCFRAGGAPDLTSSPAKPFAKDDVQYETLSAANITAGTITPTAMSINQKAGFSIVKYTGNGGTRTVPHGLSSAPDFIIIKSLSEGTTNYTGQWDVYHTSLGANKLIALNTTGAYTSPTNVWTATPDSNVITIGSAAAINYSSDNYIAYCWHSVEGYSKFGSYTGNGSTDGPFVYCGFRPAFVMLKCSSDTTTTHTSWAMYDNARDSSNVMNKVLYANKSINEGYRGDGSTAATDIYIDFLSNGFKVRSTKEEVNDDDETYIYMAFAEQPFKYANAR
jgi:hypothetical protein